MVTAGLDDQGYAAGMNARDKEGGEDLKYFLAQTGTGPVEETRKKIKEIVKESNSKINSKVAPQDDEEY
jgi:hypothetical protein